MAENNKIRVVALSAPPTVWLPDGFCTQPFLMIILSIPLFFMTVLFYSTILNGHTLSKKFNDGVIRVLFAVFSKEAKKYQSNFPLFAIAARKNPRAFSLKYQADHDGNVSYVTVSI